MQNGMDEYKWWIEEAIEHGEPSEPVVLKRGGETVREKTVLPTPESILGLWIEQFVEGGRNCIPNLVRIEPGTDSAGQVRRRDET